jgi:tRNA nucleotidyltransferase/poly(A) polymerase
MARRGVLENIIPYTDEWRVLERLPADSLLRLFVLARTPSQLKERLRLSNEQAKRLDALALAPSLSPALRPAEQRRLLYQTGVQNWPDAVRLSHARSRALLNDRGWRSMLQLPERWLCPQMPVKGQDLVAAGFAPGPEVGAALRHIEDWWIASDFKPGKDELLQQAFKTRGQNDRHS